MNVDHNQESGESASRRFRVRTFWATATVIVLCGLTLFFLTARRGGGLLEQVRATQKEAPQAALQLIEQAIADAGGTYPDAQVMKCQLLGTLESWRAAERYYDTIESPQSSDQKILIELALAANQSHSAWLAERALLAANHPGPEKERVLRLLLTVQYDLGEMGAVLKICDELAQLAPQDPEPWLVSAGILHETEQLSPALSAYQEALKRSPSEQESLRVRFQMAEVSLHLGNLETAEQHIKFVRNLSPTMPEIDLTYAKLLRRKGQNSQARSLVESILAKERHFPGGIMLRGLLNFDAGDFHAAAADFRAVVAINPFQHNAHYKLGQTLQRLGMTEESESHFERSLQLTNAVSQLLFLRRQLDENPTSRELRLKLAEQHLLLGDAQSAAHWRRTAEDRH
ncbi:MAG: tetratricopeptide repeat protein [Planctomycetes bacterium]|nr:tetratricopeptide repeat protein [Planctomycetota bacterium]